ncbi:MAG: SIS domain-containing protein [Aerococcus suis]|nr:SIS domain-containing protein [Aerococcus suis]
MFTYSEEKLDTLGARITTEEIKQQPKLWQEALDIYEGKKQEIKDFLAKVTADSQGKRVRVIFTGAGTSQYVGDTVTPHLNQTGDTSQFVFESYATTDIVAHPQSYLFPDETTILVSFARSGNSPESLAAKEIANKYVNNIYHLLITCASEGKLATESEGKDNEFLLLMPEKSNDAGFAMTGSFTCMTLSAMLVFDTTADSEKAEYVKAAATLGEEVVSREEDIQKWVDLDYDRVVYLGSGSLSGLAREAQLKLLELTAGQVATVFDSSMGFRHGPKSFINEKTIVFDFVANDTYTSQYDYDILTEVATDDIAQATVGIEQQTQDSGKEFEGSRFTFSSDAILLPAGYLALPYIMVAQTFALLTSVKVDNTPDTPSATGTVNRVVKGVTIHEF